MIFMARGTRDDTKGRDFTRRSVTHTTFCGFIQRPAYGFFFVGLCILLLAGCKESPRKPIKRIEKNPVNMEQVSKNIERLTLGSSQPSEDPENLPSIQQSPKRDIQTVNLAEAMKKAPDIQLNPPPHVPLSQFKTEDVSSPIRVVIRMRGMPKGSSESWETRLWEMLERHVSQPWVLQKARQNDGNDTASARLTIDFKRSAVRIRRVAKAAPSRTDYQMELNFSLTGFHPLKSSWQDWAFKFQEEALTSAENAIVSKFWHDLEHALPVLTAIGEDETAQWIRAQGLSPNILMGNLNGMRAPNHRYYPNHCLVSRGNSDSLVLRLMDAPYTPPQTLSVENVDDMRCTRKGLYILSHESSSRLALYYQPLSVSNAWKTRISMETVGDLDNARMHLDDEILCIWPASMSAQLHTMQIHCYDRNTGLPIWKTTPVSGAFRGFAYDRSQLVFATDQAVFALSREGVIRDAKRIKTRARQRSALGCQIQNRLVFSTAPGQFVAYNLDSHEFDWQYTALDPNFIHCSQQNTFIFSESGGYILAVDIGNGRPMWKYRSLNTPKDAMTYGNIVYLLLDRAIIALDRETGRTIAQIPMMWQASRFIQSGHKIYIDTPDDVYSW